MSDLFKGERLYTEAEMLAAIKRALDAAIEKTALLPTRIPADARLAYHAALEAAEQHIRAIDPAQFIKEPKK